MKFSDCSVAIISPQWLLWALGASVGSRFSASWFSSWSWKVLFMRRQEDTCVSLTAGSSSGRHSGPLGPRLPLSALPLSCPGQVLQPCACTLLPTWNASPPAEFLLILAFQGSASAPSPPGSHPPRHPRSHGWAPAVTTSPSTEALATPCDAHLHPQLPRRTRGS